MGRLADRGGDRRRTVGGARGWFLTAEGPDAPEGSDATADVDTAGSSAPVESRRHPVHGPELDRRQEGLGAIYTLSLDGVDLEEADADRAWLVWSWYEGPEAEDDSSVQLGWVGLDAGTGLPSGASSTFRMTVAGGTTSPAWDPGLAVVPDGTVLVGWRQRPGTRSADYPAIQLGRFDSSGAGASAEVSDVGASDREKALFASLISDDDAALVVWEGKEPSGRGPPVDIDGAVGRFAAFGAAPLSASDYAPIVASDKTTSQALTYPCLWQCTGSTS